MLTLTSHFPSFTFVIPRLSVSHGKDPGGDEPFTVPELSTIRAFAYQSKSSIVSSAL